MTQKIDYDRGTAVGFRVARFTNDLMNVLAEGRRLKAELDAITFGSDFSALAKATNLPDPGVVSSTAAQDLWTIVSTAMGSVDSPQVAQLARLDQG